MQQTNLNSLLQESLKRLDELPYCPELPSDIKLPMDMMEVVDVEDMLEDETYVKALVSSHLLKRTVTEMRNYDYFKHSLSLLTTIRLQLRQVSIKKVCPKIQHRKTSGLRW